MPTEEVSLIGLAIPFVGALAGGLFVKYSEIGYDRKKRYYEDLNSEYDQLVKMVDNCRDVAIKYYSGSIAFKTASKLIPELHEALETTLLMANHHGDRAISFHHATWPFFRKNARFYWDMLEIQRRLHEFHRAVTDGNFGAHRMSKPDVDRIVQVRTAYRRFEASMWLHRMSVIRSE